MWPRGGRCAQVLRARPSTRPSSSFRGMIYNTHPDGGEDLVGLDVLEPVLLLAFVEQLQVRLEMRRTKGAEWKWRRPPRQMGWIASAQLPVEGLEESEITKV